ncbi:oxidoreductase (plasmid) [Deinococcus aetherius]|uniref:Oxidoreductase n=1 Tax=Deinococcus aetherius TaxID=200252 RepID=A0ABM8AKD5_9DEIO|nr:NAD(P)H-binding protein [Deinococcus aetherius]BDP44290.1 oxidoreductase [Deinococcus aetherius]
MTETVLVLGSTGKTGRRLVPRLTASGLKVRAASRKAGEGRVHFDWDRRETHLPALRGADALYLVAPDLVEDPTPVVGPFLESAEREGVTRVVLLSSLGTEFPNEDPDSGRRKVERQVMASGLAWTILRPSGFAQNFSEGFLLPGILRAGAVASVTGSGAVALVDAGDIAAVAAAALTEDGHSGATYAVTGPEALTFAQAAATIGQVIGRDIGYRQISPDELTGILVGSGIPADYAAMVVRDQEAIRDGAGATVTGTVAQVTGRPATPFAAYAAGAARAWTSA